MTKHSRLSLLAMGLLLAFAAGDTRAQSMPERMEVSVHYTHLRLSVIDSSDAGIGMRLGFNINEHLAVEAEGNYFRRYNLGNTSLEDKAQGMTGVKAGRRSRWFGAFGKLRAGAVVFPSLRTLRGFCVLDFDTPGCARERRGGSRFALDAGAVLEFYPARRVIVRADAGDTMIRFKNDRLLNEQGDRVRVPDGFSHNFQFTLAVGFRF